MGIRSGLRPTTMVEDKEPRAGLVCSHKFIIDVYVDGPTVMFSDGSSQAGYSATIRFHTLASYRIASNTRVKCSLCFVNFAIVLVEIVSVRKLKSHDKIKSLPECGVDSASPCCRSFRYRWHSELRYSAEEA